MSGSVGKALDPTGGKFLGINNIPKVGPFLGRVTGDVATGGLAEFARRDPWTGLVTNTNTGVGSIFNNPQNPQNPYVSGPFSLDPAQFAADQTAIKGTGSFEQSALENLATKQYRQTLENIPSEVAGAIQQENPRIMEALNKNGLLTSSAYPQEIARQQEYLTQNLLLPATQQFQQAQTGALETGQGFETGALQRGLSLEDQINNANISKSIGQIFAPQAPTGKQNFGTAAQGVGALAPWFQRGGALGKA